MLCECFAAEGMDALHKTDSIASKYVEMLKKHFKIRDKVQSLTQMGLPNGQSLNIFSQNRYKLANLANLVLP